ncbi:pre-mRNA-splicing factor 18 [Neohortaea acidophila]|uniref:Pre-mRNA-splicing factor 18 n=1 Tax=Neohortaea acidophila TaxID=245834 RepID=A0A6A6Q2G3_9PEZI|nr:pre-mRNA-splicing factor 18 [Neohortaea acidophila]KAF2485607.1 pre-mRNA-splicing factor 18 [Neohortaea acidophila]
MDFASLMKSQIAASGPKSATDGGKKYLKRSEVEAQRHADYLREQEELEKARVERLEKKRKRDEEEAEKNFAREEKKRRLAEESRKRAEEEAEAEESARRKRLGLPPLEKKEDGDDLKEGEQDIEEDVLLQHLQDLGEPRRLFGETHIQRLHRYRKLTDTSVAKVVKMTNGPIPTSLELVREADMKVPTSVPKDEEGITLLQRQIASYFDLLLSEWQLALARRAPEVKESFSGKKALQNHMTAISNLTPLFRKLESNTLPRTLLAPILEITHLAQSKRYVDANDAYLRLSIGKAAWPIGVTMVGIHERSAREKLHETEKGKSDEKAHILADEVTRKMLQGIKRCLSFAQTRWPPDDLGQLMG